MPDTKLPNWFKWAQEIQALSQTGLNYSQNEYETLRYNRLKEIAAEIIASHSEINKDLIFRKFDAQIGYATPKVDVRGTIIKDDKILLVQERTDERWCMPGGWADVGESPAEMVIREVWEESGFEVVPKKVIGVYDANKQGRPLELFHAYKIIFLCEITGGNARTSNETMGVDFFDFNNLPSLSSNRTNEKHLNDVLSHYKNPEKQAVFE